MITDEQVEKVVNLNIYQVKMEVRNIVNARDIKFHRD
jgi:hypothetical protein